MAIAFAYTVATNVVVVTGGTSGVPATFADFVTADRAGTGTSLKAASAASKTYTLTYAVRPVELLAIVVKCIVAAKTTETDYLFITGTDAWDAAQTENIDVSAGNGTYTSTKRWRTITNISCSDAIDGTGTVWADGTLAVTQDIWGVIWDLGKGEYQIYADFNIGDGSTSTYFTSQNEKVCWYTNVRPQSFANATLQIGVKISSTQTRDGSTWQVQPWSTIDAYATFTGKTLAYGWTFKQIPYGTTYGFCNKHDGISNVDEFIDCVIQDFGICGMWKQNPALVNDVSFVLPNTAGFSSYAGLFIYCSTANASVTNLKISDSVGIGIRGVNWGYSFTVKNLIMGTIATPFSLINTHDNSYYYIINPDSGVNFTITWESTNTKTYVMQQYFCDIEVFDRDGNGLSGVTVLCQDQNNDTAFSVSTDVNGNIVQQTITYKQYKYNGAGGTTTTTYSPHKFTISKAGYQTLVLDNITVDHPIVWHLELQQPSGGGGSLVKRIGTGVI